MATPNAFPLLPSVFDFCSFPVRTKDGKTLLSLVWTRAYGPPKAKTKDSTHRLAAWIALFPVHYIPSQALSRALKRHRMNGEETALYMTAESVH